MRNSSKKGSISSMGLKKKLSNCGAESSDTSDGDNNGGGGTGAVMSSVAAVRSGERR